MREHYQEALQHIKDIEKSLIFYSPKDRGVHIGLPNSFVAPSSESGLFGGDQFYWDSYFIILGLITSNKISLAKGIVENFAYLFKRFGIIPSRNRNYNLGISQPPFLTSMILEVFDKTKDKIWLKEMAQVAESELKNYWMGESHRVFKGLSRYADHWFTNSTTEHESGWDMTSRFDERCLDFLPIDLNSLLFKYESDLSKIHKILKNKSKEIIYLNKAKNRKKMIINLMWNEKEGTFFDYDYKKKEQSNFYSIASLYPLWAGLAKESQAKKMKRKFLN